MAAGGSGGSGGGGSGGGGDGDERRDDERARAQKARLHLWQIKDVRAASDCSRSTSGGGDVE